MLKAEKTVFKNNIIYQLEPSCAMKCAKGVVLMPSTTPARGWGYLIPAVFGGSRNRRHVGQLEVASLERSPLSGLPLLLSIVQALHIDRLGVCTIFFHCRVWVGQVFLRRTTYRLVRKRNSILSTTLLWDLKEESKSVYLVDVDTQHSGHLFHFLHALLLGHHVA